MTRNQKKESLELEMLKGFHRLESPSLRLYWRRKENDDAQITHTERESKVKYFLIS